MRMDRIVLLTVVIAAAFWGGAVAQSSSDCSSAFVSLSPCLNYTTGNSSTPSKPCCTNLASVVGSQPLCLCQVLNGNAASSLGVNINQTLALGLPTACNVQTPSASHCNAPSGSPSGSNPVPSSTNKLDGNNTKMTFYVLFFFIFVALRGSSLIAI
ncbi:hypothetical protein SLA2020_107350 [Shorea laevis]